MALKIGAPGLGNLSLGNVNANAKKQQPNAPKATPIFPPLKPVVPPTDYSQLYVGPDPLVDNKNLKLLAENGISAFRPELLAVINFEPAYSPFAPAVMKTSVGAGKSSAKSPTQQLTPNPFDSSLTAVGKMLRVQLWSRELIKQDMLQLVAALKSYDELESSISAREDELVASIKQAADDADFLFTLITDIERLRNSFDLRRVLTKDNIMVPRLGNLSSNSPAGNDYSAKYIFTKYLGFDESNFTAFTNTKIVQQALLDLKRIIARGSQRLLSVNNQQRKSDADPMSLNYAFDAQGSTFKFDIAALKSSPAGPINASTLAFHKLFDASLPANLNDRAKLLAVAYSRELRISIGLGDSPTVTSIAAVYPNVSNAGDPFTTIIGSPGYSITDNVAGADQSMVAMSRLTAQNGLPVLPFEETYVNVASQGAAGVPAPKGTLFIPGPSYYVDPIVMGQPAQFDTAPLKSLVTRLNRNVVASVDAIGRMLQLPALVADPGKLFEPTLSTTQTAASLFLALHHQLFSMAPKDDSTSVKQVIQTGAPPENAANKSIKKEVFTDPDQPGMFMGALVAKAQSDVALRNELFRYFLLSGLAANIDGTRKGSFFDDLSASDELQLTAQNVKAGLTASIEKLATMLVTAFSAQLNQSSGGVITSAQKNGSSTKNDPYLEPQYLSFVADKNKIKWLLSSMATKATSLTPGFTYTWMNSLEETLRAYNDILNKRDAKLNTLTRRSSISLSTMALMVFESFVSLMAGNMPAFFVNAPGPDDVRVVVDVTKMNALSRVVQVVRSKIESNPALSKGITLSSFGYEQVKSVELQSVADAIANEDNAVILIMQMLDAMNDGIQTTAKTVIERFAPKSADVARLQALQTLVTKSGIVIDKQQAVLTRFLVGEIEERLGGQLVQKKETAKPKSKVKPATSTGAPLVPSKPEEPAAQLEASDALFLGEDVVTSGMANALFSMLREPQYKAFGQSTTRVLSVGIPAGFSDNLTRVVRTKDALPGSLNERQNDIVSVNVYKKDEQYDGIVFKPQSFLFELTRFVSRTADPDIGPTDTYSQAAAKMKHLDFSFELSNTYSAAGVGADKLFTDPAYGFLTLDQKGRIFLNHVTSVLLELYVRLLTGLSLNEQAFVAGASTLLEKRAAASGFMKSAATTHFSKVVGAPVILEQAVGGDPFALDAQSVQAVDDFDQAKKLVDIGTASGGLKEKLTEDIRTFARLFAARSMLSDGQIERARLVAPKLFERVFNIAIDANAFEIDVVASDSKAIATLTKQGAVVSTFDGTGLSLLPRSTDMGHVTFEKYFVDIEVVNSAGQANVTTEFQQSVPVSQPTKKAV